MILTASDVSSLESSLGYWEWGEYVSAFFVFIGCAGEFVSQFTGWVAKEDDKNRRIKWEKASGLVLIAALAFELVCLVRTNQLSGQVIASLNDEAEQAKQEAQKERSTRAELQALASARHIPASLRPALIEAFRKFSGRTIEFMSYSTDAEGYGLCESIRTAAHAAGMADVDKCGLFFPNGPAITGVGVLAPGSDRDTADSIAKAILYAGKFGVSSNVDPRGATIVVFVGIKNPFWMGDE
jgi:hypothetical protein